MRRREGDGGFGFHVTIASTANSRVKDIVRLRRRRHGSDRTILVEGFEELSFAVGAGVRPTVTYFCPELAGEDTAAYHRLLRRCASAGAEVVRVGRVVFEKMAYRRSPDGWLALLPAVATGLERLRIRPAGLLVVCESVEKPGNLGAILRTADAAGVDAVIAAGPVTDWGNPNLVRASKGVHGPGGRRRLRRRAGMASPAPDQGGRDHSGFRSAVQRRGYERRYRDRGGCGAAGALGNLARRC
jgi:hypothetical protein